MELYTIWSRNRFFLSQWTSTKPGLGGFTTEENVPRFTRWFRLEILWLFTHRYYVYSNVGDFHEIGGIAVGFVPFKLGISQAGSYSAAISAASHTSEWD
jgi:hypothetical protein